ncbi:hypothetical protein Agub_g10688, partial [Astrephomene gubernaculifera]
MDTIKGHPEHVETVFGEAIVARDESLVVLAGACGLGPPDLCWLQKAPKSALTGATGEAKGYYHYCLGVDASSSAAVAAYFATLTSMVEAPTFLQGLFSTSETRIERGFYCCYDPLSRLDVRCELCIPGGVVCGALDCEGNVHDVTPDLWRNCVVATFLRSELYEAELALHSPAPVARHPPLPGPLSESRLLGAVAGLYEDGILPEALEGLSVDQACGVFPEHCDLVLHTLLHYFARRQRWGTALEFFARLAPLYPPAALFVAAVQRECGLYDEALSTLSRAVEGAPGEGTLLAALAAECLAADQVDAALRLATQAARLRPLLRPAWLTLARAYCRLGAGGGAAALVVLNLVPPPPLPGREEAMLHVVVPPAPKSVTRPAVPPYDLDVAAVRQVLAEEDIVHPGTNNNNTASAPGPGAPSASFPASFPASTPGAPHPTLPGALMIPREPLDAAAAPDTAPLRITKAVLAAVYAVLQDLVALSGWDGFLQLRSSVFVMHADSDVLRQQQREAEERERQLRLLHRQLSATLPPSPGSRGQLPPPPLQLLQPPPGGGQGQQQLAGMTREAGARDGMDLDAAFEEAVVMGLSDYPEHLETGYDDPRVAAAREAHRRHLREIAERQARLEAAEGGAYADDEWDGSSSLSSASDTTAAATGGRGGGSGGAGGGTGGARSTASRSQRRDNKGGGSTTHGKARGRGSGRRTGSGGGGLKAALDEAALDLMVQQQQRRQQQGPAGEVGIVVAAAEAAAVEEAARGAAAAATEGVTEMLAAAGVVDAGELVRQEAAEAAAAMAAELAVAGDLPPHEALRQAVGPAAVAAAAAAPVADGAAAAAVAAESAPTAAAAPSSWWGAWFGGGGTQPRYRERGPLGEACEAAAEAETAALVRRSGAGGRWRLGPQQQRCGVVVMEDPAEAEAVVEEVVEEEWWRPAEAGAPRAEEATTSSTSHVVCTSLAPLITTSQHSADWGNGLQPSLATTEAKAEATWRTKQHPACSTAIAAGNNRKQQHQQQQQPGRPWPTSAMVKHLACKLTACTASYRRRRQQRRLQRALLASLPSEGLALSYGPLAPLLPPPAAAKEAAAAGACCHVLGNARVLLHTAEGCLSSGRRWRCGGASGPRAVAEASGDADADAAAAAADATASGGSPSGNAPVAAAAAAGGGEDIDSGDDSGLPLLLQNPDADRRMVLEGLDATESGAKRLCVRWLDELIVALWHDLQAFLDWKALDTELQEAGFRSHAEIVAGLAPAPSPADYQRARDAAATTTAAAAAAGNPSSGTGTGAVAAAAAAGTAAAADGDSTAPPPPPRPPPVLPSLPPTEWLRRGLLAERLHHEADALAAYQAAVSIPPSVLLSTTGGGGGGGAAAAAVFAEAPGSGPGAFSMIAWQAIMRLALVADPRDTSWALRAVQAILSWLEARAPAGSGNCTAVPFTSGFVQGTAVAAAARTAGTTTTTAASSSSTSKLSACPVAVVHCLHLLAAVLGGEEGVEAVLSGGAASSATSSSGGGAVRQQRSGSTTSNPTPTTTTSSSLVGKKRSSGGGSGGGGGGAGSARAATPAAAAATAAASVQAATGAVQLHPVAAAVLRSVSQAAAAAASASAGGAGGAAAAPGEGATTTDGEPAVGSTGDASNG